MKVGKSAESPHFKNILLDLSTTENKFNFSNIDTSNVMTGNNLNNNSHLSNNNNNSSNLSALTSTQNNNLPNTSNNSNNNNNSNYTDTIPIQITDTNNLAGSKRSSNEPNNPENTGMNPNNNNLNNNKRVRTESAPSRQYFPPAGDEFGQQTMGFAFALPNNQLNLPPHLSHNNLPTHSGLDLMQQRQSGLFTNEIKQEYNPTLNNSINIHNNIQSNNLSINFNPINNNSLTINNNLPIASIPNTTLPSGLNGLNPNLPSLLHNNGNSSHNSPLNNRLIKKEEGTRTYNLSENYLNMSDTASNKSTV